MHVTLKGNQIKGDCQWALPAFLLLTNGLTQNQWMAESNGSARPDPPIRHTSSVLLADPRGAVLAPAPSPRAAFILATVVPPARLLLHSLRKAVQRLRRRLAASGRLGSAARLSAATATLPQRLAAGRGARAPALRVQRAGCRRVVWAIPAFLLLTNGLAQNQWMAESNGSTEMTQALRRCLTMYTIAVN